MAIDATTPTTVSATYNLWAVASLQIAGDGCVAFGQQPNPGQSSPTPQPISCNAVLVKARVLSDGVTWERSPLPGDVARLSISDVKAFIATNTTQAQAVATAYGAIVAAIQAVGSQQGAL